MSTRFLLVRHGETAMSKEHRFAGSTDVPLTDYGREMAAALAKRLRPVRVDVMFCSPLIRCRQTAEAITEVIGRKPTIEPEIRECHFGDWEAMNAPEVMERSPEDFRTWISDASLAPPNGESWDAVGDRVGRWFDEAAKRYDGRTVLAVTHGGPILSLARRVTASPYVAYLAFEVDPCSITTIQSRGALWRLRHLNDTSHIRDPLLEGPPPPSMPP